MKKILFILFLLIPFLGFSQFEAGEFINADTAKITGNVIIYPHADSVDQYYYSKMRDPSEPLDGVNLRTLFSRLANLDSLGLLVTDLVSGHQEINTGETQIYFPSAFDSNSVIVIPFVRRISDDAVIDYLINDVDSLGFDIVVWEDNVKLSYVASQNISHSSDIFGEPIYSADSLFIKQSLRNLIADTSNYLRTEIDPIFSNDSSYIKSNIRDWNNSLAKKIDEADTTFWGRPETDPFYSNDSLFLNRTTRDYVSDSSKLVHWADTLPTSGARIATGDDIKSMIDGSGTANILPKFSDANTITNSVIKDDGTNVTIEQNSVQPFTSVASGAVDNTLYLKEGKVGVGTSSPEGQLNIVKAARDNFLYMDDYSTSTGHSNYWFTRKSHNATKGTLTTTVNNDALGAYFFQGVNSSNEYAYGVKILARQNGDAGTYVPSDLIINTYSATAQNTNQFVLLNNKKVGINTSTPDQTLDVNSATGACLNLIYNDADGSPANATAFNVSSTGDLTITPSGHDVTLSGSNLVLQSNTNASNYGIIYKGTAPFIHNFNYGNNGTVTTEGFNVFIGGAGNLTMGATATQTYHASNNTFSGFQAGYNNTTGYNNTFSGFQAGYFNTTGYSNTFSGVRAGYSNTTGQYNTFSGYRAGYSNTTGYSNTFSGFQAGLYIADGTTGLANAIQSLFVGSETKAKADNSTNEIVIGYGTIGNGSNSGTWGNTSMTNHYFTGTLSATKFKTTQITAALTDNTPTDAEIDTATGLTPSTAGAGWQCTIKDNNGSGLLYKVESDGTDWYYSAMTKAL